MGGSATFGGTATLTATLISAATNAGIVGKTVVFTLGGTSAGTAVTGTGGVATLTGVTTSDAVGTQDGAVAVSFAGDADDLTSQGSGNLVVAQAGTALASVSGTATYGGTATLTATLTSTATSAPIAGEMVAFKLDGTTVGTAMTNASGVASLAGVATADGGGTDAGAVVASFAGNASYQAATNASGSLVVSPAATTLLGVSGAASSGHAVLTARLFATATGTAIPNAIVTFTLDGVPAGQDTTDSNGVVFDSGVPTSDPAGVDAGGGHRQLRRQWPITRPPRARAT